jgi:hypothetical protein
MNEGIHQSELKAEPMSPVAPLSPSPQLVNPNLSGSLAADHEALRNDLLQAQDLAADFQRQLAGKSNEYAQLKQILEKTQHDLEHLQEGIMALRGERHRLANEAMRAAAFEAKLMKITGERDRLRVELEVMREALARTGDGLAIQLRDRDRHIAELVVEMVGLRQALEEERKGKGIAAGVKAGACMVPPGVGAKNPPPAQTSALPPLGEAEAANIEIFRTARDR